MSVPTHWNPASSEAVDMRQIDLRRRKREDAEMDITPMIDITFLLLIFFLVCSTMDRQNAVPLPPAYYGTGISEKDAVIITMAGEENHPTVYLGDGTGGAPLPEDRRQQERSVIEAVETGLQEGRSMVLIKAAKGIQHGEVSRISSAAGQVEGIQLFWAVLEAG
jgi:biopolymer transport protein ExbD